VTTFLALLVLAGLMAAARWIPAFGKLAFQTTVSLGFVLIFGFLVGRLARRIRLPRITGYILAGVICGPYLGRFLTGPVVRELRLIDDLALALIAFTAGGELRIRDLAPRWRSIVAVTGAQTGIVGAGMFVTVLLASPLFHLPPGVSVAAMAIAFGIFAVASSPATAVAIINEARARGTFTDTVLGVTVLKDVVVLVLVTLLLPVMRLLSLPGATFDLGFVGDLAWEVGGSLAGGVVLGYLVTFYVNGVGAVLPLFIVGVSILVTQVARQFHLEPLLLCMVAGFVIENATRVGDRFIDAIERSSLPVYVVFFAISGAAINLQAVRDAWYLALILVVVRLLLVSGATALGERAAARPNPMVRRWGGLGFVAQAGVTLGLASIVARKFPGWGEEARVLALAMVAINQLVGPVAFRWALSRSGEATEGSGAPARNGESVGARTPAGSRRSV